MNKLKFKFPFFIFIGLLLFLTTVAYINVTSKTYIVRTAAINLFKYPSKQNLNKYYLEVSRIAQEENTFLSISDNFEVNNQFIASRFQTELTKINPSFSPSIIQFKERTATSKLEFEYLENYDLQFPKGFYYVQKGYYGADIISYWDLSLTYNGQTYLNNQPVEKIHIDPREEVVFSGQKESSQLNQQINSQFSLFLKGEGSQGASYSNLIYPEDKSRLENVVINKIAFTDKKIEILSKDESFKAADLTIDLGNCSRSLTLELGYLPQTQKYFFIDPQTFLNKLCIKQFNQMNGYLEGTCVDCTLYPADKIHAIRPDYSPEVISIDFAPGFQRINKVAFDDFYNLYIAAKKDGIHLFVTSGYRSYSDQLATFNYWTSVEMQKGYSRSQAEAIANTYSARPGFSEHQLGTALDLNGAGCNAFAACTGNQTAWDWLAANAHKYGFVVSYPEDKQSQTGYIYEPWHYRWIGKDLSLEYQQVKNEKTLQQYLFDLGQY